MLTLISEFEALSTGLICHKTAIYFHHLHCSASAPWWGMRRLNPVAFLLLDCWREEWDNPHEAETAGVRIVADEHLQKLKVEHTPNIVGDHYTFNGLTRPRDIFFQMLPNCTFNKTDGRTYPHLQTTWCHHRLQNQTPENTKQGVKRFLSSKDQLTSCFACKRQHENTSAKPRLRFHIAHADHDLCVDGHHTHFYQQ